MRQPSPRFIQGVTVNITYWQEQISQFTDDHSPQFLQEQANIILAVDIGLALSETKIIAAELLLKAYYMIERCGNWQSWLLLFEKAAAGEYPQYPPLYIRLLNRQGQLLRLQQQTKLAIKLHKKAEAKAQTIHDPQLLAEVWFNLSVDYRHSHHYEQAEHYGQQALAHFMEMPDSQRWQATMFNTLGLISLNRFQLEAALGYFQQSLKLWQQFNEPTEQARVRSNLATTYQRQDQFESALYFYNQALENLATTGSELDKAEIHINVGAMYFKWGQYDKAEISLRLADSPALRQSGNFRLRAIQMLNLGNTLLEQQRLPEAEKCLQRSLFIWQRLKDDLMLANTMGSLAEVLTGQGEFETAVAHYERALTLLESFQEHPWALKLQKEFNRQKGDVAMILTKK